MKIALTWRLLVLLPLLSGCTLQPTVSVPAAAQTPAAEAELPDGTGWWFARFHIQRPEGESTRWHIGALVAGEVIAPVFERHYGDILIWRVHRRAPYDRHGHVFSFIFYATPATASRVYADIENHPVVSMLQEGGLLSRVTYDDVTRLDRPGVRDTSDGNWPDVVQETWPALAMGASRMWLDMVSMLAAELPPGENLEKHYRAVNDEVSRLWAQQGQHAVLHHLSAIYGYKPIMMRY